MESPSNGNGAEAVHEIRVTFHPDGNMELHAERVGPPQFWAAAHLLEQWGDSEFAMQQMAAQSKKSPIVTPRMMPGGRS